MATPKEHLVAWLRDAHAMEEQAETMLSSQSRRLQNYPELKARIDQHIEETREQARRIETCLERLDAGASSIKDISGKMVALGQGLSGIFVEDEVVKGTLAGYTFEHMEIASYKILITAAEAAGEAEIAAACQANLAEEMAMAEWLDQHAAGTTRKFLNLDQADQTAKR
ncbi:ferritin-like domain-containing protein [Ensifer sp. NPDC090286]|uniref:ferritin-like domain-containing protein n=1 Tax=Ensifer sp. NPDC090286 TaxID=3363991 RepID=UPI00383B1CA9